MKDSTKKTFFVITGVLVVIGILFINATESVEGYEVGDLAADFQLTNVDGKSVSLSGYEDAEGFIVVFTCNTCPYAKAYETRIMELDKAYGPQGFPVIAINPNDVGQSPGDSQEEMLKRSKEKGYTFPYLRDDQQKTTQLYGASKTPHVYVLNKEETGKYRVEYIGAIDDSPRNSTDAKEKYVEDAVNALLNGQKPKVTSHRAIGCGIKWKV